jgi:hypothetical protein
MRNIQTTKYKTAWACGIFFFIMDPPVMKNISKNLGYTMEMEDSHYKGKEKLVSNYSTPWFMASANIVFLLHNHGIHLLCCSSILVYQLSQGLPHILIFWF